MKSYDETTFLATIKRETGMDIHNGDYGFITGTAAPYYDSRRGFSSQTRTPGWCIWKRNKDKSYTEIRVERPVRDSLELTIGFLKDDVSCYEKLQNGYYYEKG